MAITATKPRVNAPKDVSNNFWWTDLQSRDVGGSMDFYGRTLGWEFRAETDGSDVIYHTAHIGGVKVAGLGALQDQAAASGMPSVWTDYVCVEDADAICARATELGGTVMMQPMDVMEEGRMAILLDPTGAAFGLWQPGNHRGADAVNQPSTLTWTELYTSDVAKASTFYGTLFGWTVERSEQASGAGTEYHLIMRDGEVIAGIMPRPEEMGDAPDCWVTYLGVADVHAVADEVKACGGTVVWGPMQTGPGRSIGVKDPQGAMIHFMQLDEWPAA